MPRSATAEWIRSPSRAMTTMGAVTSVREGLPLDAADTLGAAIRPDDATFKYNFVPKATYARRKTATQTRLSPQESERLVRVGRIWAFATEVWGGPEGARRFINAPHMLLDGRTPLDVALESELGGKMVEEILGRLAYGSAV